MTRSLRICAIAVTVLLGLVAESQIAQYDLPTRLSFPRSLVFTNEGAAWVSTARGVLRYDPADRRVAYALFSSVGDLTIASDGAVWAAGLLILDEQYGRWRSGGGVIRIDPKTLEVSRFDLNGSPWRIAASRDGIVWAFVQSTFTSARVIRLALDGTVLSDAPVASRVSPSALTVSADGALWGVRPPYRDLGINQGSLIRFAENSEIRAYALDKGADWVFSEGEFLWVVDHDGSVSKYGLDGQRRASYELGSPITGAVTGPDGTLWLRLSDRIASMTQDGRYSIRGFLQQPVSQGCDNGWPEPMAVAPTGEVGLVNWFFWNPPPITAIDNCTGDRTAIDRLTVVQPGQHAAQIPVLSPAMMAALAMGLALAALCLRVRGA